MAGREWVKGQLSLLLLAALLLLVSAHEDSGGDESSDTDGGDKKVKGTVYVIDTVKGLYSINDAGVFKNIYNLYPPFVNPVGLIANTFDGAYKKVPGFFVADYAECFTSFADPVNCRKGQDPNFLPSKPDGLIHFVAADGSKATTIFKSKPGTGIQLRNPTHLFPISKNRLGVVEGGFQNGPCSPFDGAIYQLDLSMATNPFGELPPEALTPLYPSPFVTLPDLSPLGDPNGVIDFEGGFLFTDGQDGISTLKRQGNTWTVSKLETAGQITKRCMGSAPLWQPVDLVNVRGQIVFTDYLRGVFSIDKSGSNTAVRELVSAACPIFNPTPPCPDARRYLGMAAKNKGSKRVLVLNNLVSPRNPNYQAYPSQILQVNVETGETLPWYVGSEMGEMVEPFDIIFG